MERKKVLVILADGFEETEAVVPIDILRRAGLKVITAGLNKKSARGSHGLEILADTRIEDISGEFDALLLPGGSPGAENLSRSGALRDVIIKMSKSGGIVAAICASPVLVLAPLGVLDGKKATCYAGMEKEFTEKISYSGDNVVVDGNIITSRGPGTAAEFGFRITEILSGRSVADELRKKMLFA